jgi:hypothetical protein
MRKVIAALITAGFFLAVSGQARADAVVGVSFGPQTPPTNWTSEEGLLGGSANNLINESGSPTDIDLSYSITGDAELFNVTPSLNASTVPIHTPSLANLDGNIDTTSGGTFTATLSNLTASSTYDVWVLVARDSTVVGQDVDITGTGSTNFTQSDATLRDLLLNASIGSSSENFDSYALPITASSTGTIVVDIAPGSPDHGFAISGLAISAASVPLPSPALLTLLGLSAAGIMGWRRAIVR